MEKLNNPTVSKPTTPKPNKAAVFFILLIFAALTIFLIKLIFGGSSNATIGRYTQEELPENFEYTIVKDESNPNIGKNQLEVEINQKLTEGQLATIAEELYNMKDKQKRFYIFYNLKDIESSITAWATSHFDPELEISINGSTNSQDNKMLLEAKKVSGKIIGIFDEQQKTSFLYTVYEANGKTFIKTSFKDGGSMDNEVTKIDVENGIRYNYKEDVSQGEYFILNNDVLRFYNDKNEKFTEAIKLK